MTTERSFTAFHILQPDGGGVPRVVADLVRAQARAGVRVIVACHPGLAAAEEMRASGARVLPWRATRSPGPAVAGEVRAVARLVRDCAPDVVHAHSAKAGLAARLAVRGRIPTLYQPHAWSFLAVDGLVGRATRRWERFATRWTDRIVCVSAAERALGEAAGISADWEVIPNGIDLGRFGPGAPGQQPVEAGLHVVCVGRLCRQKGQDVLLEAWPRILAQAPDARLTLVGDGPLRGALEQTAPAGVEFAGEVCDVVPWLRRADLVVLPSRWEGMALAPLEAMAVGAPVVVTDVAGARESLPPGQAGCALVPPQDPGALAAAVSRMLTDSSLRRRAAGEAYAHAHQEFDVRRSAAAVMALYERVASPTDLLARERMSA
ncbi:glycosyltransferase [Streptomyces sp. NPDC050418]|uniref:glycosyltransferase n=1 Tax=Streptomyces sp. NPDC050418 TaxID=3365612 RepID=UPI0037A212F4